MPVPRGDRHDDVHSATGFSPDLDGLVMTDFRSAAAREPRYGKPFGRARRFVAWQCSYRSPRNPIGFLVIATETIQPKVASAATQATARKAGVRPCRSATMPSPM